MQLSKPTTGDEERDCTPLNVQLSKLTTGDEERNCTPLNVQLSKPTTGDEERNCTPLNVLIAALFFNYSTFSPRPSISGSQIKPLTLDP
jgi:hypothetical protein